MGFPPLLFSIFYVLIAAIYIIPVIFLNSFSNNAIKAVNDSNTESMTISMRNLKNLFVFVGVSTIVMLIVYTITLISIGIAAMFSF